MKTIFFSVLFVSLSFTRLLAADETEARESDKVNSKDSGSIIIQKTEVQVPDRINPKDRGSIIIHKDQAAKVFVESGSSEITGSPEEHMKAAYRTWDSACQKWKNELKQNNKANLMISSCGTPERVVETLQSEKIYTYKSKGTYKIRVIGK